MKKEATAYSYAADDSFLADFPPLTVRVGTPRRPAWAWGVKRLIDMGGALAVLVLGAPVLGLLALFVKLSSPGPIFFRQVRLGKGGAPFAFYKFRTMHHNNDDRAHRDFCQNFINGQMGGDDDRGVFKMVSDPRVTRIGTFLRRTSLDELPQFWNVLRGEMSLVGPRPPISYELEHYQDWHKDRLKVKPGLTGLWQVSGRSSVSFDEMVMLDLHYIQGWSLALDLKIMLKTLPVMVRGDGAY